MMTAVCAALVLVPGGGASASGAPSDPPGTVRVGPTSPSTDGDVDAPVAGSSAFLAYTRVVQLAGGDANTPAPTDEATRTLFVRSSSGTIVRLGAVSDDYENYSLVRSTLVADVPVSGGRVTVHWWDAATAATGSVTLARGDELISAAPDGFVYADGPTLVEESISGTTTELGTPFPHEATVRGVAGDGGLVVIASRADVAYLQFGTTSQSTPLRADTNLTLECETVSDSYAGCIGLNGDDYPRRVLLIPLSGGAPTTSTENPGDVAISGSTLLWKGRVEGTGTGAYFDLQSLQAGSSRTTVSTTGLGSADGPAFVSAYGDGVGVTPSADRIVSVTSASSPVTTLVNRVASPVTAASFSLTAGRVAYVADERVSGSTRRLSAFSAELTSTGGVLTPSTPAVVHAGAYYDTIAASGPVTAYETRPHDDSVTLDVAVHSQRPHRIPHVYRYAHPTLSGDRLLYLRAGRSHGHATSTYFVYDVADHRTAKVYSDPSQCCEDQPALAGHELAYVRSNGSVWRRNLETGRTERLAGPRKGLQYATIYAVGDHVAWEIVYLTTDANGDVVQKAVDFDRDARTASSAVKLPSGSLVGLSAAGAILGRFPRPGQDLGRAPASYSLRTFGGSTVRLLPRQVLDAYPQIVGSTMAWIDSTGTLRAAPVPG